MKDVGPPRDRALGRLVAVDADDADRQRRIRDVLLAALTFAAGVVDAVSFLGMGQIFTANMTGNTVFLALAAGQGNLLTALHSVDALIGFSVGAVLAGRVLGRTKGPGPWPVRVSWLIWGEFAFVAIFASDWVLQGGTPSGGQLYLLIGLSSVGMGLQSAAARHLAVPGIQTTVVTTALTGLMAEFAALGISGPDQRRWAVALLALFLGAVVGAALMVHARSLAPVGTAATLGFVSVFAAVSFRSAGPVAARHSSR